PVLRIGAARAGVDRDDGVACVVLAGEERVLLQTFELTLDRSDLLGDLGLERAVEREELLRVVVFAREALVAFEPAGDARVFRRDLSRAFLVVPEARLAQLRLERGAAGGQRIGVKGNHGPTRGGSRSPRAA